MGQLVTTNVLSTQKYQENNKSLRRHGRKKMGAKLEVVVVVVAEVLVVEEEVDFQPSKEVAAMHRVAMEADMVGMEVTVVMVLRQVVMVDMAPELDMGMVVAMTSLDPMDGRRSQLS